MNVSKECQMKRLVIFIVLIVFSTQLSACQTGMDPYWPRQYMERAETGQSLEDYDILDKGPVQGGKLSLFTTEPDNLNPILTTNTYTADFSGFIYEGLTRLDKNQQAVPVLSDKWSVSSDGLIWNFHIRDGVKWQDGEPFTAYDAEFTIQAILNPKIKSIYKPLLRNISTCAAVDSANIRIALLKPYSYIPETMTFPILAKHQFKQKDILSASEQFKPLGTGPYEFVSFTEGKSILMKSHRGWWNLNASNNDGADGMYIDTIEVNIFKKPDDAMAAFQTGEVDVFSIKSCDLSKYKGRNDLIIKKYTSRDFEFLAFNLRSPVFGDPYVRKAISLAIDKEALISEVLRGEAIPAEFPILPESWATDTGKMSERTSDNLTDGVAGEAETPGETLLLGGWKESGQGYYKVFNGVRKYLKVELLVNSNNSVRIRAAQKLLSQLLEAGINAELKITEWKDMMNRLSASKFDLAFVGCRIPQIPDISFLYSAGYLPSALSAQSDDVYNIAGYFNPLVDDDITALFSENDANKKRLILNVLKDRIKNDLPYIGLYFMRDAMVYSKNIRGPQEPDTWNRYNGIYNWYKPELY